MIKTFTGPMFASKTAEMVAAYQKIWNKEHIMVFKPKTDDRDLGEMKSRDYEEGIPAKCVETVEDILREVENSEVSIRSIFIDEAQFITGDVRGLIKLSIIDDIDVYVGGLNMTAEQQPFGIMPNILAVSDEVVVVKASCYDCGREAPFTYYEGSKDSAVLVGNEGYFPLCARCLNKRYGSEGIKKVLEMPIKK